MKILKTKTKELSVLDNTHYANQINIAPASPSSAVRFLNGLTDEELTHVELWAGGAMIDSQDNLTFYTMNLSKEDAGYRAMYLLIGKPDVPAEIMDKANAYDILMGGETNG